MINRLRQNTILYIFHGVIFFVLYLAFVDKIFGLIFYIASAVSLTIGLKRIGFSLERRVRGTNILFPFSRILYFIIPCIFVFHLFYTFQEFAVRVFFAIVIMILTFFSVISFGYAAGNTPLFRKRINLLLGLFLVILFYFLTSVLTHDIGLLLLLPLSITFILVDYMQYVFFGTVGKPYYFKIILITGLFAVVFIILFLMNLLTADYIFKFYDVVIKVYLGLLAISAALTVYVLTQRQQPHFHSDIVKPVLGLAFSCLILTGITGFGVLIGTQPDSTMFAQGIAPEIVFNTAQSVMVLVRNLIIYFVVISFPFALFELFAIIENSLNLVLNKRNG